MKPSAAIEALVDEMGAEMQVRLRPHPLYTSADLRRIQRRAVVEADSKLTSGEVGKFDTYEFSVIDTFAAKVVIIWDTPKRFGDRGRIVLRQLLTGAGVDETEVAHVWAYPVRSTTAPTTESVERFRTATLAAIDGSGARYVLWVGGSASGLWRRELKVEQLRGKLGVVEGKWFGYVINSPYAVFLNPQLNQQWREDVIRFSDYVAADDGLANLSDGCTEGKCTNGVWLYDPDGMGWCKEHADAGIKARSNARVYRRKRVNKQQETEIEL